MQNVWMSTVNVMLICKSWCLEGIPITRGFAVMVRTQGVTPVPVDVDPGDGVDLRGAPGPAVRILGRAAVQQRATRLGAVRNNVLKSITFKGSLLVGRALTQVLQLATHLSPHSVMIPGRSRGNQWLEDAIEMEQLLRINSIHTKCLNTLLSQVLARSCFVLYARFYH